MRRVCCLVFSDCYALCLRVAQLGPVGLCHVSLVELLKRQQRTSQRPCFLRGAAVFSPLPSAPARVQASGKEFSFTLSPGPKERHLYGHMYDFGDASAPLLFDFVLSEGITRSLKGPKDSDFFPFPAFLQAEGRCVHGDHVLLFSPASASAVICAAPVLRSLALAAGVTDGKQVALALAGGMGHGLPGKGTLRVNGTARQLHSIRAKRSLNKGDALPHTKFWDAEGSLNLTFHPIVRLKTGGITCFPNVGQTVGHFVGSMAAEDGRSVRVDGMAGFLL